MIILDYPAKSKDRNYDKGNLSQKSCFFTSIIYFADISPGTEKGTTKGKISAPANLPPLNHGNGMAPALPPLNHNVEIASSLPPLNHAEEHAANLPPLLHGVEQAGNLPPLNHGSDALQSFSSLPPLNHGDNEAAVLPPLMHGIEQAKHTPSASFEKQSSQNVDALSAFTSQVENAAPSSDNGKLSYQTFPVDLKGEGRGSLMPKTYNADAGTYSVSQKPSSQLISKSREADLIKNYNNIMEPVVQGKETIDQAPLDFKNRSVGEPVNINGLPFSTWQESAQSKGWVLSTYDDPKELQSLLRADLMSQRTATSTTAPKFGIPVSSGIHVFSARDLPSDLLQFICRL